MTLGQMLNFTAFLNTIYPNPDIFLYCFIQSNKMLLICFSKIMDGINSYALHSQLSWTHYRLLRQVEVATAEDFYLDKCAKANCSTRLVKVPSR